MDSANLSDLFAWAKDVDQGIQQLEQLINRNCDLDSNTNSNDIRAIFQNIIDNARQTKVSAMNDLEKLKVMSQELKEVLAMTEEAESRIEEDLKNMLQTLFPGEYDERNDPPSADISLGTSSQFCEVYVEFIGSSPSLPRESADESLPESLAEVEITPGLINKVPKSRLQSEDIPGSDDPVLRRPIRKKTLIFSPNETTQETHFSSQLVPKHPINSITAPNASEETSCDDDDDFAVLERPTRPVLSSELYKFTSKDS